jgi:NAD-dependent deacetylase
MLRPDVVWFEEAMPMNEFRQAVRATECDVFMVIGTSSLVYPAAELPLEAGRNGATLVEINTTMTEITEDVHFHLDGPSGVVLPELVGTLRSAQNKNPRR